MEHSLKILEQYAQDHCRGDKPWELRKNDRGFNVGDTLLFEVIDNETEEPTGFRYRRMITYLFEGQQYGLKKGYCIMTIKQV